MESSSSFTTFTTATELQRGDVILEFGQRHYVFAEHISNGTTGYLKARLEVDVVGNVAAVVLEIKNHDYYSIAVKILLPDGRAGFILADKRQTFYVVQNHT